LLGLPNRVVLLRQIFASISMTGTSIKTPTTVARVLKCRLLM